MWKGRREEAWTIIKKLHHDPLNLSEADASTEFTQIVRQVDADNEENPTFYQIFKKPT